MDELLRQARQFLENERAFGLDSVATSVQTRTVLPPAAPDRTPAEKEAALELLKKEFPGGFFGEGHPDARLLFVGETRGAEENQLLTKIIEAMKLSREAVYVAGCGPSLPGQIEIVRPRIICTLGQMAIRALLGDVENIELLRGRYAKYEGIALMPTYHPADLLKRPDDKKLVWSDMKIIMKDLDIA